MGILYTCGLNDNGFIYISRGRTEVGMAELEGGLFSSGFGDANVDGHAENEPCQLLAGRSQRSLVTFPSATPPQRRHLRDGGWAGHRPCDGWGHHLMILH